MNQNNVNSTAVMDEKTYKYFLPLATNSTTGSYSPGMHISVITEKIEIYAGETVIYAQTNHQQIPFTCEQSEEHGIGTFSKLGSLSTTNDCISIPPVFLNENSLSYIEKAVTTKAMEINENGGHAWVFVFKFQNTLKSFLTRLGIIYSEVE